MQSIKQYSAYRLVTTSKAFDLTSKLKLDAPCKISKLGGSIKAI